MKTINSYTGYVPYTPRKASEGLEFLLKEGIVKPGSIFLDWGAGEGNLCIAAAQEGLHAYGIEINGCLVKEGKRRIEFNQKSGDPKTGISCRIAEGSYFTPEYIALRVKRKSAAIEFERGIFTFYKSKFSKEHVDDHFPEEQKKMIFYPRNTNKNPYKELGIALQDIDLFFSYTWGIELPAQLEMFSLYAKPEAIFLNSTAARPKRDRELLRSLNLRCRYLYRTYTEIGTSLALSHFFDGLPLPSEERLTLIQKMSKNNPKTVPSRRE